MKGITLRQLRAVDAVMAQGHFGRAAETLAISQPALSVQIRDLEARLGGALFERGPRGVSPTAFGSAVAERARAVLRGVDEIADLARAEAGFAGRLRLGVIPTIAPYLLPRALAALRARWPDLDLEVRETRTDALVEALGAGGLDAALLALPLAEPSLIETPLFEEPFVLVRSEREEGPPPTLAEMGAQRLLLLEEGHCLRDQTLSFCGPARRPGAGLDGTSLGTLVQLVGAGLGVTLIPEMAIDVETRAAAVKVSAFDAPGPARTVGMVWRATTPLAPRLAEVAAVIGAAR